MIKSLGSGTAPAIQVCRSVAGRAAGRRRTARGRCPLVQGLPDGVAVEALHGPDARLAALSLLGQGLHGLQPVEAVGVGRPIRDADDLRELRTPARRRPAGCARAPARRSRPSGGPSTRGPCRRLPGVLPVVGEVLVDEDGHDPAALAEDLDRLVPEPALGIR